MQIKTITLKDPMGENPYDVVIIDRGNGEFTSMSKEHYEELEAAKNVAE